jgi:hypothetical protein
LRLPKLNSHSYTVSEQLSVTEQIDVDLLETVEYVEEIDPEDPKSFPKVIKAIKALIRSCNEYKSLMNFLKVHHNMNQSFFFKGVEKTADKKFSLEVHHAPFVIEDIITTVTIKRMVSGESTNFLDIAHEVMYLHYTGDVGLVPLDKTSHALIHSENAPEVFVPIQFIPFGDFHQFYKDYKKYIPENVKSNYAYVQDLSMKYDQIKDVIPKYMKPKYLYFAGFLKVEAFEELLETVEGR